MKSPIISSYLKALESLNDQLCYYLFATEEIGRRLSDFDKELSHHYTSHVFAKNSKAKKIYVKLEELPSFQKKNITFTFGAYFSTSYEVLTGYLEDSLDLLKQVNTTSFVKQNRNSPEETYYETILASGMKPPDAEIIDTLTYMRLRRNYFSHRHQTLSSLFNNIIDGKGTLLNSYWKSKKLCIYLDFSNKDVDKFTENIVIELIILIRIILLELDSNLWNQLDHAGLLDYLAKKQFEHLHESINIEIAETRAKRFKKILIHNYGITCTIPELIPLVKKYGVR